MSYPAHQRLRHSLARSTEADNADLGDVRGCYYISKVHGSLVCRSNFGSFSDLDLVVKKQSDETSHIIPVVALRGCRQASLLGGRG